MAARRGSLLRGLSAPVRLSLSALLLVVAGGSAASLVYLQHHYGPKDEREGLTLDDLTASFHGLRQGATLLDAVRGPHGAGFLESDAEKQILLQWLEGERIAEEYDALVEGREFSPADVLDLRCVRCHERNPDPERLERGESSSLALDNWPDVKDVAFTREFQPVPVEILIVSTHVHALTLPLLALAAGALLWCTRWSRWFREALLVLMSVGLLADLGCMWVARSVAWGVLGVVAGGALFNGCLGLALAGVLLDLWLPGVKETGDS